jgi:hypothetical protein
MTVAACHFAAGASYGLQKHRKSFEIQRRDKRPVCKNGKGHQHKRPAYESGAQQLGRGLLKGSPSGP